MLFKKFTALMIVVAGVALAASNAQAAETMKPFVLAWSGAGEMPGLVSQTEGKRRAGGRGLFRAFGRDGDGRLGH